jgi:hypothetical protein
MHETELSRHCHCPLTEKCIPCIPPATTRQGILPLQLYGFIYNQHIIELDTAYSV